MYNSRCRIDVLMTGLVDRQDWGQNWYISSELLGGKVSYELPGKVGVHSFCWIGYYYFGISMHTTQFIYTPQPSRGN